MSRLLPGRVSLLLFGVAFAIRSIPAVRVFDSESGAVQLPGGDPLYHLRRVLFTLENFPQSLRFDPYINFPFGGEPIWPPLFDGLLALLALPFHRGASPEAAHSVEVLLVWVPPLLGALAVIAVYHLARRVFDDAIAAVAAAVLAGLPAHYWYSQVGFVDHHAAVALGYGLLLLAATRWLADVREGPAYPAAFVLGAAFALLVLLWPGSLLQVAVVEAFLFASAIAAGDAAHAVRHARSLALANAVAALAVAPFTLGAEWILWSAFSPAVLSNFQPWLFAALTLFGLGCGVAWSHGLGEGATLRVVVAAGSGLAVLGLSVSCFPQLIAGADEAARWLFKDEAFQATVSESRPLFRGPEGGFDRSAAEARLTRFVYLVPLVAVWMWRAARQAANARAVQLVVVQLLALGAVTLLQRRFFNSWSVAVALAMGFALVTSWRFLWARFQGGARLAAVAVLTGFALWLAAPVRDSYGWPLHNVFQAARGQALSLPAANLRARRLDAAARWLRDETPATEGFLDPRARPAYGVLALWTHGHRIEMLGRRPSIANNFGDDIGEQNFLASYRFFQAEAEEALQLARELGARYVFLRTTPPGSAEALSPLSMQSRLSAPREALATLPGLTLVYDEAMDLPGDASRVRIFELREPAGAE